MFKWEKQPYGGIEHTSLWRIFCDNAEKIENLPNNVSSDARSLFKDELGLLPDGYTIEVEDKDKNEETIQGVEEVFCFEVETDWRNAIDKIAQYSFGNMQTERVDNLILIVKEDKNLLENRDTEFGSKLKRLESWIKEMEGVGCFRIRWFFVSQATEQIEEIGIEI